MMRPSHPDAASVGDALLVALGQGFTRSIFYSDTSKRHSTVGLDPSVAEAARDTYHTL